MVSINSQRASALATSSLLSSGDEPMSLPGHPRSHSEGRTLSERNEEVRKIEREGTELLIAYSESRSNENPHGNPLLLAKLYASQKKSLSHFARLKGIPDSDAEDIISSCFVNLMARGNFDPSKGNIKYLYRLFDNTCADFYRRAQTRSRITSFTDYTPAEALHAGLDFENILDAGALPPIEKAIRDEEIRLLKRGLNELADDPSVEALREQYYEGKKIAEIAKNSKLAIGTLKSRLLRGKERLHSLLLRYGL